jgi:hypothetical protein
MDNFFTHTLADLTLGKTAELSGSDENPFIADLFNDKLTEVGHIHFVPAQNRIRITASVSNEEAKTYHIVEPRLEFLKFIFENTNNKVKKAVRFYFQNSPDAKKQYRESKEERRETEE